MTISFNYRFIGSVIVRVFGISAVVYGLLLANFALHLQQEALQLNLAYDQAVIQLMQQAHQDGDDQNDQRPQKL